MKNILFFALMVLTIGAFSQKSAIDLPITWDDTANVDYSVDNFGGGSSMIVVDPADPTNLVMETMRPSTAMAFAGVSMNPPGAGNGLASAIPLSATNLRMTVRVWSPDAGVPVLLKAENKAMGNLSVETTDTTTVAGGWEMLEFDFAQPRPNAAPFNAATTYDKLSIFFNFNINPMAAGDKTYYWDDVMMAPAAPKAPIDLPITWEDTATVDYAVDDFGGGSSVLVVDPTNPNNLVMETLRPSTAQSFAGVSANPPGAGNGLASAIPLTMTDLKMNVRVWSPDAGVPVLLKVEDKSNGGVFIETTDTTTMAGAWETLEFDFATPRPNAQAFNPAATYDKASIFFNFLINPMTAGDKTYYWDDLMFGAAPKAPIDLPITWEDTATVDYAVDDFGGGSSMIIVDPTDPTNLVMETMRPSTAQSFAGVSANPPGAGNGLASAIPLTATNLKMTVRVWSPDAGVPVLLKVEDKSNGGVFIETTDTTTMPGAWELLEFDFATPRPNAQAFNPAATYDKVSIFFNFLINPMTAGDKTYYWDDLMVVAPPKAPIDLPITWEDSATVDYSVDNFGGGSSMIVTDPADPTNTVMETMRPSTAMAFAGVSMNPPGAGNGLASVIPLSATSLKMTVRVWSPDAGVPVLLKAEDKTNPGISVETTDTTTVAGGWEMLEFDFAQPRPNMAAFNAANTYDKLSIFFNFNINPATAGDKTYYWDDVMMAGATPKAPIDLAITWEDSATVDYSVDNFGGGSSMIVTDPTDPTNTVMETMRPSTAAPFAGVSMNPPGAGNGLASAIPLSATSLKMTVRVWSPDAGVPVLLKAEDKTNPGISVETTDTTTVAGGWEMLEFDFAQPRPNMAAFNAANTYDKLSIFFNFDINPMMAGDKTYYWDDVMMAGAAPKAPIDLPITWEDSATVDYSVDNFGGGSSMIATDPTDPTNTVMETMRPSTAAPFAGVSMNPPGAGNGLASAIPLSATSLKMTVRVWSPDAGVPVLLKAEDKTNAGISVETTDTTTVAGGWEMLEFDFAQPRPNAAPFNAANTYDKLSIFFNFDIDPMMAGDKTYYWDDVMMAGATPKAPIDLPITWEDSATVDYTVDNFGGGSSMIVTDPTDPTNTVMETMRPSTAAPFAGVSMNPPGAGNGLASAIPLSATSLKLTVRVWSPDAGVPVLLKAEDKTNPGISVETTDTTTVAGGWEMLEFDFTQPRPNMAAFNAANTYDKLSIFFNFDINPMMAGDKTYYWDDVMMAAVIGPMKDPIDLPITWEDTATVNYSVDNFGGGSSMLVVDPTDPMNLVMETMRPSTAQPFAGVSMNPTGAGNGLGSAIPFTATELKMNVRVWSPDAGVPVLLKAEDKTNPGKSVETTDTTTVAGGWEILEFDFSQPRPNMAAFDAATTYDKLSIFFNFDIDPMMAGDKTYYWDDVKFGGIIIGLGNPIDLGLTLAPNPAQNVFVINSSYQIEAVSIFSISGKELMNTAANGTSLRQDVSALPTGTYFVRVETVKGASMMKFVKQ
ncbi:MAG: T9SS type A sorting domain-containing protein [Bacteroidia bacterium]